MTLGSSEEEQQASNLRVIGSTPIRETKICTKCRRSKFIDDFGWKNKAKNRRQPLCKLCQNKLSKAHYNDNRPDYLIKVEQQKIEIQRYIEKWKSNPCTRCERSFSPKVMDAHHVSGKEISISLIHKRGWSLARLAIELNKCQLLCACCHRIVTFYPEEF